MNSILLLIQGGAEEARQGISELTGVASSASNSIKNIALYFISAILAIGLIYMIWAIVNKKPNAKYFVIGWIVALFITIIFII